MQPGAGPKFESVPASRHHRAAEAKRQAVMALPEAVLGPSPARPANLGRRALRAGPTMSGSGQQSQEEAKRQQVAPRVRRTRLVRAKLGPQFGGRPGWDPDRPSPPVPDRGLLVRPGSHRTRPPDCRRPTYDPRTVCKTPPLRALSIHSYCTSDPPRGSPRSGYNSPSCQMADHRARDPMIRCHSAMRGPGTLRKANGSLSRPGTTNQHCPVPPPSSIAMKVSTTSDTSRIGKWLSSSNDLMSLMIAVWANDGQRALTRIPCAWWAPASERTRATTAALLAA